MNSNIRRAALALTFAGILALSGCRGTDTASGGGVSVVRDDASAEYRLTTARVGTVTLTETVRVKYFAARQESYCFTDSGLYYDSFAVSVGDEVHVGDVLATLDCEALDADIARLEADISELERTLDRNGRLMALFDERQGDLPLSAADSTRRRGYETAIRDANDELSILTAELDGLRVQREGRVITANIDGTVTFVRSVEPGETSMNGRVVVTVTDIDSCAFSATMEHPESLVDGEIYAVSIDGATYEITPATAEELGIEPEVMNEKSSRRPVYFTPITPSVNLAAGASGSFTVTVESRENVVYVPVGALTAVNGVPCVYVPDEHGLMSVRPVTAGLSTSRYVEIIAGLESGESVIMY